MTCPAAGTALCTILTFTCFGLSKDVLAEMFEMKHPGCPYCGATEVMRSPSGHHLLCASCNRILVQPRIRKPRGRRAREKPDGLTSPPPDKPEP